MQINWKYNPAKGWQPPLSDEQREILILWYRLKADQQPGLTPERRKECRRIAGNLEKIGEYRRARAREGRA